MDFSCDEPANLVFYVVKPSFGAKAWSHRSTDAHRYLEEIKVIVLHAGVVDGDLHLWGERSDPNEPEVARSPKRQRAATKSNGHDRLRYDAGTQTLTAAMTEAGITTKPAKNQSKSLTAWIPTQADQPVPSGPLVADSPTTDAKTQIAPWLVSAIRLTPEQSVELLCLCLGKQVLTQIGRAHV